MELVVPVSPIPAPRPRVSRKGWTYYPAKYKEWRETVGALLPPLLADAGITQPLEGPLWVITQFKVVRPKTTKLTHPKGDIDNFEKAIFDQLTHAGAWVDDSQIVHSHSTKAWARAGEEGHIALRIIRCSE
jgi:Holliday junction resolvase RusA-like endonuclease